MRLTIRDVARASSVSVGTVSKALNNSGSLRQETRNKVIAVANELGYRPNDLAQSLHRGQTFTVGLISNDNLGRFSIPIIEGLEEHLAEAKKQEEQAAREQKKLSAFTEDFLKGQVSEDEIAMVRRLVMNAVKQGKFEALVYSFPSDLCTDSGRAINSGDPQWTDTLQGKAKKLRGKR